MLKGRALQEALEWAYGKNLNYQDKEYLAASKEKEIQEEIAAREKEADFERARKDREAVERRNQVLTEAIVFGFVVFVLTVVGAVAVVLFSKQQIEVANQDVKKAKNKLEQAQQKTKEAQKSEQDAKQQANASIRKNKETKEEVEAVKQLNKLAGELETQKSSNSDYNEALRLSALSFNIDNHSLKQALVFAAQSQAYQQLEKLKDAEQEIKKSQTNLDTAEVPYKAQDFKDLQIQVLFYKNQGSLLAQKKENHQAIEAYTKAFNILNNHPKETDFTKNNQFITGENITSIYRGLIELLSKNNTESEFRKQVEKSLKDHLYAQLEDYLKAEKWNAADMQTYRLILYIAKREQEGYLDLDGINSFSCPDLGKIDKLWLANSDNRFGFSVQKEIWRQTGNRLVIKTEDWTKIIWTDKDRENYRRFAKEVGWYNDKKTKDAEAGGSKGDGWIGIKRNHTRRGTLPFLYVNNRINWEEDTSFFMLRFVNCNI